MNEIEQDLGDRVLRGAIATQRSGATRGGPVRGADALFGAPAHALPYPTPFDWTEGLRSYAVPAGPGTPFPDLPPDVRRAAVVTRKGVAVTTAQIYHQPLIQIKMRVIEVARTDGLAVSSVLEYVSRANSEPSLTSGKPLNHVNPNGYQNLRGLTRFVVPELISNATTGTGMLVNLTSEHINWVASLLAIEMNADVITAPEVVTLNGQNVEFVAGEKLPFELGQNVIQGTNNNIQQVFYKHVGTMVSITPRIVNWGLHAEGKGQAEIVAGEIDNWNGLVDWMIRKRILIEGATLQINGGSYRLEDYRGRSGQILPYDLKANLLTELNKHTREDLVHEGLALREYCGEPCSCNWKPENCTIDLSLVVRLSEGATASLDMDEPELSGVNTENNVRAVANVIQVKSGHGVVMAGLIGEREIDDSAKVPVLGDVPVVGFLFRSKATSRVKTEVLIFVEACVLDPDPGMARAESAHDFQLGQPYVAGELLDNPLECGMYRAGFGTYLPPHTCHERVFWQRFGRKVRKIKTHVDDAAE
jgi:hypothetical protein